MGLVGITGSVSASEVRFLDFEEQGDVLEGIGTLLRAVTGGKMEGMRTAVKVHFGELGNFTHIRPEFVRRIVDELVEEGAAPFVAETTTLYPTGGRFTASDCLRTAAYNGFSEGTLGCPLVIADGPDGYDGVGFVVTNARTEAGPGMVRVARRIAEADALVVLSHVKGHALTGMGGSIKHLGMGCTTKDAKKSQHEAHGLEFYNESCNGCGKCADSCRFSALVMDGRVPIRERGRCMYCNTCLNACDSGAIKILEEGKARFQEALAHAAAAVMAAMAGKPVIFLNFIMDVTPFCDCVAPAGRLVVQNVGILGSRDPVAIDRASLDLVDGADLMPGWNVSPPDVLGKINGTRSTIHLDEAERLGIGQPKYVLVQR